jgi:FecR protein
LDYFNSLALFLIKLALFLIKPGITARTNLSPCPIEDGAMSPRTRMELQQILSALCDGALTPEQMTRLEELLGASAEGRRLYLEYLDLHARLLVHPDVDQEPVPAEAAAAPCAAAVVPRPATARLGRYVLVAAVTLVVSLAGQFLWRQRPAPRADETARHEPSTEKPMMKYVTTLSATANCDWEAPAGPLRAGTRLPQGELRLRSGAARLRFDGGTDLLVEGPAAVRVESSSAATLLRGKVVFRTDGNAVPFDLRTPSSTLVDFGTEYAVEVGPEGEEIHVFDGEVRRRPNADSGLSEGERLMAGQAKHFGPLPDAAGQPMPLDPDRFLRQIRGPAPLDPRSGLLAYEGFDYVDPKCLPEGRANGGSGWIGPWKSGFARPIDMGDANRLALNVREGLTRPGATIPGVGGSFSYTGFAKYWRRLETPVRLDTEGIYYISFLFRREGPQADTLNALAILLRTTEELERDRDGGDSRLRLNVGIGGPNELFTHLQKIGSRTPLPLNYGATYLLVVKIAANSSNPDQAFMRVYGPEDTIDRDEPGAWTVAGPSFESDLVFDWLEVHVNSKTRQTIDEIRVGTTWSSVTGPWIGGPNAKTQRKP